MGGKRGTGMRGVRWGAEMPSGAPRVEGRRCALAPRRRYRDEAPRGARRSSRARIEPSAARILDAVGKNEPQREACGTMQEQSAREERGG